MLSFNYKEQEGMVDKSRKVRGRDRVWRYGTRTGGKAWLGQDWHRRHGTDKAPSTPDSPALAAPAAAGASGWGATAFSICSFCSTNTAIPRA